MHCSGGDVWLGGALFGGCLVQGGLVWGVPGSGAVSGLEDACLWSRGVSQHAMGQTPPREQND